jgi:transcription elongation factor Elf1
MAISDFIATLFKPKKINKVEAKPNDVVEVPVGYRPLFFHCWLCDGTTRFAHKIKAKRRKFTIECSRCGVENAVTVIPPQN